MQLFPKFLFVTVPIGVVSEVLSKHGKIVSHTFQKLFLFNHQLLFKYCTVGSIQKYNGMDVLMHPPTLRLRYNLTRTVRPSNI
jgi:hypothetical protein